MITKDKVTEIFCIIDEFNRNLNSELENNLFLPTHNGKGKYYCPLNIEILIPTH